ncbi:40S ribosomal protein S2 [Myotis brandtii]|uniref:40S ribosomal protein S2 n=1 Tax=Myotis brandtii TaxID=109478 RepID=S7P0M9_MYOBR|nr:40S ribosomal protein S2 [Myotis brandtii]
MWCLSPNASRDPSKEAFDQQNVISKIFKPLLKRKKKQEEEEEEEASKRKGKTSKGIEKHISELQRTSLGDRGTHRGKAEDKEWIRITKLGHLMKDMKIKSQEEIYFFSPPIKESEIIDFFLGASLKEAVLKIMLLQKQTCTGQRTLSRHLSPLGILRTVWPQC